MPADGYQTTETIEIVRATMRFAVEPWRMAQDPEAHNERVGKVRQCGGSEGGCHGCQLADALYDAQRSVAGAMNLIARHHERRDGALYQDLKLAGEELKLGTLLRDGYRLARSAYPELLSGIVASASKIVEDKWSQQRWKILAYNERSPSRWTSDNAPIPLRHADVNLTESEDSRDLFFLEFSTAAARADRRRKQWRLPIRSKDQAQYKILHALVTGEVRLGAMQLQRDRRHKWHLRIAYARRAPLPAGNTQWAAVNRGIVVFLAVVTEKDKVWLYDGHDIEAYLAQMQARRKQYQRTYKVSGRKGHGRNRALQPIDFLSGKATRWRQTRAQTIARETARHLKDSRVTHLALEDFKGIRDGAVELLEGGKPVWDRIQTWPYFELGQRLRACCEELGIVVVEISAAFSSRTCPECGVVQKSQGVKRTFVCSCGFKRQIDTVTAMNQITKAREQYGDGQQLVVKLLKKEQDAAARKAAARERRRKPPKS